MQVLSADWVLPIEGPPIEGGAVAHENGRIVAVGTADELGLRGRVYLEVFGAQSEEALVQFEELRTRVAPHLSGRVRLGVSPHAPYSISPAVYRACATLGLP